MRSLADRVRLERALRAVALVAIALWIAGTQWPRGSRTAILRGDALDQALPRLTVEGIPESVHVQLDTVPEARHADWLAAMRGAGVGVSWSGRVGDALAIEAFRSPDPAAHVMLLAAAPRASVVSDALGPVDTIALAEPAAIRLAAVEGGVTVRAGLQPARVRAPAPATPKPVLMAGAASWETKFTIAALEEGGWTVDARVVVRPDEEVRQGGAGRAPLDTSRYAAVVLLDSAAAEATRGVAEFVRAGGGLVLAGDASGAPRVAGLTAWRVGKGEFAPLGTLPGDTAWRGLSRVPLDFIAGRRAIALETRDGKAIVAARRHHAGRVTGVGYDQTWRWRMAGGANAVAEHRAWWSRAVASVAAPVIPSEASDLQVPTGAAPLASLYDVLGPPSTSSATPGPRPPFELLSNLFGALALAALVWEWLLRRSRGAH